MIVPESPALCFCTLAIGANYRSLAELLAEDIEKHAPGKPLVILTDNPKQFQGYPNVVAFSHRQHLYCDNDKVFLIRKALSLYDTCICIDADMRLLDKLPPEINWQPGITARSCDSIVNHYQTMINKTNQPRAEKERDLEMLKKVARKLDVDIADEKIKFIHEFLFVVTRSPELEQFLDLFEKIAYFLELNGVKIGAGCAMGLAGAKTGFPVRWDLMEGVVFFDDRIERVRIAKGQADPEKTRIYFEQQKARKSPKHNLLQKLAVKISRACQDFYRTLRLRIDALADLGFYYR